MEIKIKKAPETILGLYNAVADQLGYDPENCRYDCTKIEVSHDIEESIANGYGTDSVGFGMHWLSFGPKVNEALPELTVKLQDGFLLKEER